MIGLRFWRQAAGLTQRELATLSGVERAQISRIEQGHVEVPRPATVRKLADALGVDPIDLLLGKLSIGYLKAPKGFGRGVHQNTTKTPPPGGVINTGGTPEGHAPASSSGPDSAN